jgi:hypothetical protein
VSGAHPHSAEGATRFPTTPCATQTETRVLQASASGSRRLRLVCDWLRAPICDSRATGSLAFPRKRLQTMSPLSQQIPLETSGICRDVPDRRSGSYQWRRWELNPRPRSRERTASTSVAGPLISSRGRLAGGVPQDQPLWMSPRSQRRTPGASPFLMPAISPTGRGEADSSRAWFVRQRARTRGYGPHLWFSRLFYEADRGPRLATAPTDDHVEACRPHGEPTILEPRGCTFRALLREVTATCSRRRCRITCRERGIRRALGGSARRSTWLSSAG